MSPELHEILNEPDGNKIRLRLLRGSTELIDEFLVECPADTGLRRVIMAEKGRRSVDRLAAPHAVFWWSLVVMVVTMLLAAIAAWPVIRSWFP